MAWTSRRASRARRCRPNPTGAADGGGDGAERSRGRRACWAAAAGSLAADEVEHPRARPEADRQVGEHRVQGVAEPRAARARPSARPAGIALPITAPIAASAGASRSRSRSMASGRRRSVSGFHAANVPIGSRVKFVEAGGARLSAIGLGTWQFGSREWGYGDAYADGTAVEITRAGARPRHQPHRHRRDLRVRRLRAHRRQGHRRTAGRGRSSPPRCSRCCRCRRSSSSAGIASAGAPRRRPHRPLPGALAEPGRARSARRWRGCAGCRSGPRPPRRREQLLA